MVSPSARPGKRIIVLPQSSIARYLFLTLPSFGANNIAAAAFSPVFATCLSHFGPRTTLIAWAILAGSVLSVSIFFVRARGAVETQYAQNVTLAPFKKPLFWLFALSLILQGLANFLPAAYLPSYATDLGITVSNASLLITYLSLSGMIGQALMGALTYVPSF